MRIITNARAELQVTNNIDEDDNDDDTGAICFNGQIRLTYFNSLRCCAKERRKN